MTFSEFFSRLDFEMFNPTTAKINFNLSLNQRDVLNCINDNAYTAVYKSRQDGISTAVNFYAFWRMIADPGLQVMFVGHDGIMGRIAIMIERNAARFGHTVTHNNTKRIRLSNGSALYFSSLMRNYNPEFFNLRGVTFNMIIVEEFGEMVLGNKDRRDVLYGLLQCVYGRNGKLVITTASASSIELLKNFGFQEVFGQLYFGTRKVITEKISRKKF
jgi:hypothetical protein